MKYLVYFFMTVNSLIEEKSWILATCKTTIILNMQNKITAIIAISTLIVQAIQATLTIPTTQATLTILTIQTTLTLTTQAT
ncbi:hypothetical protein HMPREF3230_00478 [Gardnerella vaginalis]|uniref:Uncharacterized protein n=1 Tax=Gardnerella vaginalis TaxID=2702 RepID=A0A135Z8H7_GARVA|nr:hypothetical protein HMPREF3230_00478 [Gardnerella vaginalis]